MIENVARAICEANGCDPDAIHEGSPIWVDWVDDAKAAIAAMQQAQQEPVAWMYVRKQGEWLPAKPWLQLTRWPEDDASRQFWTETPLYAHPPVPQWQGIETAPRDGTVIDVWRGGHRETVYWGLPLHTCGEMGQYCDDDWHRIKEPGWVCSTFGEFLGGKHNPFTHWQPLPTPPNGGSDAE